MKINFIALSLLAMILVSFHTDTRTPLPSEREQIQICPPDSVFYARSIEEAMQNPEGVTGLTLREHKHFPPEILKFPHLEHLFMLGCTFQSFPPEIKQLKRLKRIQFGHSNFIPKGISNIENLVSLRLAGSSVEIPDEFTKLKKLKYISLTKCTPKGMEKLPYIKSAFMYQVGQPEAFKAICAWQDLESLGIADVYMPHLPDCMLELQHLRELQIDLLNLEDLPFNINQLNTLKVLEISDTQLEQLPENIYAIDSLKVLRLHRNKLLPADLERLKQSAIDTIDIIQDGAEWHKP